jgi:hypothetical protein
LNLFMIPRIWPLRVDDDRTLAGGGVLTGATIAGGAEEVEARLRDRAAFWRGSERANPDS